MARARGKSKNLPVAWPLLIMFESDTLDTKLTFTMQIGVGYSKGYNFKAHFFRIPTCEPRHYFNEYDLVRFLSILVNFLNDISNKVKSSIKTFCIDFKNYQIAIK